MAARGVQLALAAGVLCVAGLFLLYFTLQRGQELDPQRLLARSQAATPTWDTYEEDIKGGVGATAAASWEGRVAGYAWSPEGALRVYFELAPPWAEVAANMPIVLRTPEGKDLISHEAVQEGPYRVYRFPTAGWAEDQPPLWLQLRFPGEQVRLSVTEDGVDLPEGIAQP